jgi:hypothetical protein
MARVSNRSTSHGAHEAFALTGRERLQERLGELVAAAVEQGALAPSRRGEPRRPHAAVARARRHRHEPCVLDEAIEAADWSTEAASIL